MAKPKYNTAEHKALRAKWGKQIAAGNGWCTEPVCVMSSRYIPPGTPSTGWHVPHNPDGTTYRDGPAHAKCNIGEGNARRKQKPKRLAL